MGVRTILTHEDPALHKVCKPVEQFDHKLHQLLDDMIETLDGIDDGLALAAPQVGILRRVVVIDAGDRIIELINPTLVATSGEQTEPEGCLSFPGTFGLVKRPYSAKVRAQNREGQWYELEEEGLLAQCFCHELDHLDGIVFPEVMERYLTEEELEEFYQRASQDA